MRPKISGSLLGVFYLCVLILPPNFDLAQAAPSEYSISNEDGEDYNYVEETTEDLHSMVPGEERGGHFEGDMILSELPDTRLRDEAYRWPNAVVIYKMDPKFPLGELHVINGAMKEISEKTCVQFKARKRELKYVQILRGEFGSGCNSHVGFQGNVQRINLEPASPESPDSCIGHGQILHQLLHTLGLHHEQSRSDRDDFVKINTENIRPGMFNTNFKQYESENTSEYSLSYNYDSIMHYKSNAFSIHPSLSTIIPNEAGEEIGQREKLSKKDAMKINAMYSKSDQKCLVFTLASENDELWATIHGNLINFKGIYNRLTFVGLFNGPLIISAGLRDSYAELFKARLYSGPNFTGVAEDYNVSPFHYNEDCHNLQKISRNVQSIQTFDSCVRLFKKRDCTGSERPYLPGFNNHENILDFSVVSVGPCFETPHFGRSMETLKNALLAVVGPRSQARLYSHLSQTGEVEEYNAVGSYGVSCQNLTVLAGQVKSVDNVESCVRLFSKSDCTGTVYSITPLTPIETRDNILSYVTQGVRSVGPCWEIPHGQHSLHKLRSDLDQIRSQSE